MAANTPTTFTPPEAVTIPGAVALEAIALLNAYAALAADLRIDADADPFYHLHDEVWRPLTDAVGYDTRQDLSDQPWWDSVEARSRGLEETLRAKLDGPALGAIATTRMAHDIAAVKELLELIHV
jgi:hypothetical protein